MESANMNNSTGNNSTGNNNSNMNSVETLSAVVGQFYTALAEKNMQAAIECCDPGAIFWHNFDGVEQNLEQATQGWQGLFDHFQEHYVAAPRRDAIADDLLVQRHLFLLRGGDGELKAKACCIIVRVKDGLIQRLDEYINLAGDLTVDENAQGDSGISGNTFI